MDIELEVKVLWLVYMALGSFLALPIAFIIVACLGWLPLTQVPPKMPAPRPFNPDR